MTAWAIYRVSQPYRYTEYLDQQGRAAEALQVISDLAVNGPRSERGWAYGRWATLALNDLGDAAAARRYAARGLGYGRGSDLNDRIAMVNTAVWSSDEETDLANSRLLDRESQKRVPDTSEDFFVDNKQLGRAWLHFLEPDYVVSGRDWLGVAQQNSDPHYLRLAPSMAATADALGHDLSAARSVLGPAPRDEARLAWDVAVGAFPALPRYWMAAEAGRWHEALASARAMDAALEAGRAAKPIYGLMQRAWIWPLEALAQARSGDLAGAQARIGQTALDCYLCLRVRGLMATDRRDWPAAERWFAAAVRRAPSAPLAYADWGRMRLARGDADGAIAVLATAHKMAPRYADPVELWGEALSAQGDAEAAARRFAEAERLAPNWGRGHLKWAKTLGRLGRRDQARDELRRARALDLTPAERAEAVGLRL